MGGVKGQLEIVLAEVNDNATRDLVGTLIDKTEGARVADDPRMSSDELQSLWYDEIARLGPVTVVAQVRDGGTLESGELPRVILEDKAKAAILNIQIGGVHKLVVCGDAGRQHSGKGGARIDDSGKSEFAHALGVSSRKGKSGAQANRRRAAPIEVSMSVHSPVAGEQPIDASRHG